jgi:hypothetical protein
VKVAVRILHESGEWVEASAWGEGQDRGDKAVYKAITGARKYGVASALGLATTDDPEDDGGEENGAGSRNESKPATRPAPAAPAAPSGTAGGDAISNDKVFKPQLAKAFKSRGFTTQQMKDAMTPILQAFKVGRIEDLNPGQRHALLHGIAEGEADKFKETTQGKAA